jgi:tagaturonate reductase
MMNDELFSKFVEKALLEEILPQVPGEFESNRQFALSILDRFRNPFIRHELLSISLNSVSKWKVRVLPSVKDYFAANGKLPILLTHSLAALIAFYHGVGSNEPELRGTRNGKSYSIKDGIDELVFFEKRWHAFHHNHDLRVLVGTVLANESLWGEDLTLMPGMIDIVTSQLQSILTLGVRETVTSLVK